MLDPRLYGQAMRASAAGCGIAAGAAVTPAEAQALQDAAAARGDWIMWFVTLEQGRAVATARQADHGGGSVVGQIVADTLDELRAMLPAGLTRRERTAVMAAEVVETWD